ncbi:histidine kinase dimerization/phosphoacceptor domain -containing protein [Mucilaginibacter celer]|uniref:histidine kinase n=1 Tax=Mucilaginibacter celer TaxID=2305508 RepID=A0A494VQ38_9SPHI|nr:histidine kinase dimerization/phosphoacceptor domain -containing protein [Mucilaginibacter celer]AYL96934.1 hypothetical protein HYN43_017185 [Mucilaginibacter celer]
MEVNKKSVSKKMPCIFTKSFVLSILLLMFHVRGSAQYYPAPMPVNPANESKLAISLKNSKPDKNRVAILLDLANIYSYRPVRKQADFNRAMDFANAATKLSARLRNDSLYNNAQLFTAEIFTLENNMKSAESILGLLNDTSKLKLLLNLSYKYWEREGDKKEEDWPKAIFFAEQAKKLSIQLHLPQYEILALSYMALVHYSKGSHTAEAELLEVLKKYNAIKYRKLQYVYHPLAVISYRAGKPDKADYYSIKTIESMQETGDTTVAGDFYYWRSVITGNNEDYQKSLDYALLAITHFKVHPGQISLADRADVLGMPVIALRKMKRYREALNYIRKTDQEYPLVSVDDKIDDVLMIGNIYRDMKAYDMAAKYFEIALNLNKKQNTINNGIYSNLGQLYVESGQYAKAKPILNKFFNIISTYKGPPIASSVISHLNYMAFLADSATGDYRSAIKHLSDYRGLEEFNLRQEQNKEVRRLEVQYGVKEKEDALKIKDQHITLLNQNYKLEQIKLKQSRMEKNIIIAAIVVLLIFTGLLYNQYRSKKRANQATVKDNEVIASQNVLINQKNRHLELLLREKEWLIKEVHHRVKNNLQTIISLLQSQAAYLENDALKAIQTSQNRIYTMSLIHQKLYRGEDVQQINMANYIPELIKHLKDSFDSSNKIIFNEKIDDIDLDASVAIPIALIINEAVTNSIKYAFPGEGAGEITVSLRNQDDLLRLELSDNGVGMDKNSINANPVSLGLQLIRGLTKEIRGEVSIKGSHGVKITILFKKQAIEYANILTEDLINPA